MKQKLLLILILGSIHPMLFSQKVVLSETAYSVVGTTAKSVSTTIETDTYWGLYNIPYWLRPDTTWFLGNKTLDIVVDENAYTFERSADIVLFWNNYDWQYAGDTTISITQSANTFGLNTANVQLSNEEGSTGSFSIVADTYWEIQEIPEWCTVDKNWMFTSETITITAKENTLTVQRVDTILVQRVSGTVYVTAQLVVSQAPADQGLSDWVLEYEYWEGATKSVTVSLAGNWTVSKTQDWITVAPESSAELGELYIYAEPNNTIYYRADTIIVTATTTGKKYSLAILQLPAPEKFDAQPIQFYFDSQGAMIDPVQITSNTTWGLYSYPSWITSEEASGYGDSNVTLTAQPNKSNRQRTDTIEAFWYDVYNTYYSKQIIVSQLSSDMQVQTIPLVSGWNLMSLNTIPTDNSILSIFGNVYSLLEDVKSQDGFYSTDLNALNSIQNIEQNQGYLVKMNAAVNLQVAGVAVDISINEYRSNIKKGWNLLGCPFQNEVILNDVFDLNDIYSVKDFDTFYSENIATGSLEYITPSKAYFINAK